LAKIFVTHRGDDEEDVAARHTNGAGTFLVIGETIIDILNPVRVGQRANGINEVDPMLDQVGRGFRVVPFVVIRDTTEIP
jgi:hypothetical protein